MADSAIRVGAELVCGGDELFKTIIEYANGECMVRLVIDALISLLIKADELMKEKEIERADDVVLLKSVFL